MRSLQYLGLVVATSLGLACGPGGGGPTHDLCASILPGDLVITEIMANPAGTDTGSEWFEIYNATASPIDMVDVGLVASREDTTGETSHLMSSIVLGAGEYLVVGDVVPDFLPAHVDYGYGSDLGGLRNTAGRLALFCQTTALDEVIYPDATSGAARGLSGAIAPDYIANDVLGNWCDATVEYAVGAMGSPGAANENCPGPQGTCDDNGVSRPVNKPVAGDLVITEYMADPSAVADTAGEWFEVLVNDAIDLNGIQVGSDPGNATYTINNLACLPAVAGTYIVFARSTDMAVNGGISTPYAMGFGLSNSTAESLFVGIDNTVLDQVTYTGASAGVAASLDPDSLTPADNDIPANWCAAVDVYSPTPPAMDRGTPGAANPQCPLTVGPGECIENNAVRLIRPPVAGQIRITEYMPDPMRVSDDNGEWFELRAEAVFDLNGLELGRTAPAIDLTLSSPNCLTVAGGDYVLFAHNANMSLNGGLPNPDFIFNFPLTQAGTLFVGHGGAVLDTVTWASVTAGAARSLELTRMIWCDAVAPYGDGDLGTPKAPNPNCP